MGFFPIHFMNFVSLSLEAQKSCMSVAAAYLEAPNPVTCPYSCGAVGPCLLASVFSFSRWQATRSEKSFFFFITVTVSGLTPGLKVPQGKSMCMSKIYTGVLL